MVAGEDVTVICFGGEKIIRTVVEDRGDVILICRRDEYQKASEENRSPIAVGFRREYVVEQ
jgi:hypothetical protein